MSKIDRMVSAIDPAAGCAEPSLNDGVHDLLEEILATSPGRRRPLSPRKFLLRLAATVVLAGAVVVTLFEASEQVYASQSVTIDRDGEWYAFYITDSDPDPAELQKAFRTAGLDITVKLVPVSPNDREPVFGLDEVDAEIGENDHGFDVVSAEVSDCAERVEGCLRAYRIHAGLNRPAQFFLGRPAKPGERYTFPADATWPGEPLAGVKLERRPVGEVSRIIREYGLKMAYTLDWPGNSKGHGARSEENVPASRIDPRWSVTSAETHNDGVIILRVTPGPEATRPPSS